MLYILEESFLYKILNKCIIGRKKNSNYQNMVITKNNLTFVSKLEIDDGNLTTIVISVLTQRKYVSREY